MTTIHRMEKKGLHISETGEDITPNELNTPGEDITLGDAQRLVDSWIRTIGVRYFSPLTNMAVLTEEVGEVARIMARRYGDQSFKAGEKTELGDELADVLWVVLAIANQTGVDLTEALRKNIEKKTSRDSNRHKNNTKLTGQTTADTALSGDIGAKLTDKGDAE
jgi:NTP pyrophosphatase (non-canonical NTP hydrolase)